MDYVDEVTTHGHNWGEPVGAATYENYCKSCEIHICVGNDRDRKDIFEVGGLASGDGGQALLHDIPRLGLRKEDVLVPSPELRDTGTLDSVSLPRNITFWRAHRDRKDTNTDPTR